MKNILKTFSGNVADDIELSILSPMYNESDNMERTISSISKTLASFPKQWELILVDDGSTDNTLQKALEWEKKMSNLHVIGYPVNCGRGKALRTGFLFACGRYVISIDFDLSYSPDHILTIYQELSDPQQINDVILGSAYMEGGNVIDVPWNRLLLSKMGNKTLQLVFPGSLKTTTCVLRGYRKEVLLSLELDSDDKEIHLEILSRVIALGYRIKEIPATLRHRKKGKSKFRFRKTSVSHLLFTIFEKPILLFSVTGFLLTMTGIAIGMYVIFLRYSGILNPNRPLIPLIILLIITGGQLFCFAFLSSQNNVLRKEVYKIQRQLNRMNKGKNIKNDDV